MSEQQPSNAKCGYCAHFLRADKYYTYRCGDCIKHQKPCCGTDRACVHFTYGKPSDAPSFSE